jgi:hypothetical protein
LIVCLATIGKYVVVFTMRMKVETTHNFLLDRQSSDFLLDGQHIRMKQLVGLFPASVDVSSTQITTEITVYYSVNVNHRKNTKGEML